MNIKNELATYVFNIMTKNMNPYWFITFHYRDGNTKEAKATKNTSHLKRVLYRICKKQSLKEEFWKPKLIFFNEFSRWGTNERHIHLISEAFPTAINEKQKVEELFNSHLPSKVKSISNWKRQDVQRIYTDTQDLWRLSHYLTKQTTKEWLPLDIINSDLSR